MVLYVIYKGAKKAVQEKLPEIQLEAAAAGQKNLNLNLQIPEIRDQIIDVVALSALVCPEIVPALPQLVNGENFDVLQIEPTTVITTSTWQKMYPSLLEST